MRRILLSALAMSSILLASASWIAAQPQPPGPPPLPEPRMEEAALKFVETYHPSRLEDLRRMRASRGLIQSCILCTYNPIKADQISDTLPVVF